MRFVLLVICAGLIIAVIPTSITTNDVLSNAIWTGFSTPIENGASVSYAVYMTDNGKKVYVKMEDHYMANRVPQNISVKYQEKLWLNSIGTIVHQNNEVLHWHQAKVPR